MSEVAQDAIIQTNDVLPVSFGVDGEGNAVLQDLAKIPHLLICGQPGSGKTSFVRTLLAVLARDHSPSEVRYIICDWDFDVCI